MRVFRAVIEGLLLAVRHSREPLPLGCPIAFALICDDHTRHVCESFEQLPEKLLRRLLVPAALYEDVQHVASLVDCLPQIMPCAVEGRKHVDKAPDGWRYLSADSRDTTHHLDSSPCEASNEAAARGMLRWNG
jgi:hypothetical protein